MLAPWWIASALARGSSPSMRLGRLGRSQLCHPSPLTPLMKTAPNRTLAAREDRIVAEMAGIGSWDGGREKKKRKRCPGAGGWFDALGRAPQADCTAVGVVLERPCSMGESDGESSRYSFAGARLREVWDDRQKGLL